MLAKGFFTVLFLIISNAFMTFAWYGHLKFHEMKWSQNLGLVAIILISWGIALFEYMFQVPANRIGFRENGGPFNLLELKVIQEVISLTVFAIISILVFKSEPLGGTTLWDSFSLFWQSTLSSKSDNPDNTMLIQSMMHKKAALQPLFLTH